MSTITTTKEHAKPTAMAGESTAMLPTVAAAAPETPMAMIAMALQSGSLQPEQLSHMMDMQERWERNQAAAEFARALAAFQADCPQIVKERKADRYYFASLDDIMHRIQPVLGKHGLSVTFDTEVSPDANSLTVVCIVRHGIHAERTKHTLPVEQKLSVNATQKYGATLKYAMRYALCAALNVIVTDEDTDAAEPPKLITEQQAVILGDMIASYGVDVVKFNAFFGVESLELLPAKRYAEAFAMLKRKGAQRESV